MFYEVSIKGVKALLNIDNVFCLVQEGDKTIALSVQGATVELDHKLDKIQSDLGEIDDE